MWITLTLLNLYTFSKSKELNAVDLKHRTRITTSIKNELLDAMKKLAETTRIPQSKLFDEALEDLFQKNYAAES